MECEFLCQRISQRADNRFSQPVGWLSLGGTLRRRCILPRASKFHEPGFVWSLVSCFYTNLHDPGRSWNSHGGVEPWSVLWEWSGRLCELHGFLTPLPIRWQMARASSGERPGLAGCAPLPRLGNQLSEHHWPANPCSNHCSLQG
jgi:hypothetical protein